MTANDTVEVVASVRLRQPWDINLRAAVGAFRHSHIHLQYGLVIQRYWGQL